MSNPWDETLQTAKQDALLNAIRLRERCQQTTPHPWKTPVIKLLDAILKLEHLWRDNPDLYRRNRVLAVVLLPELIKTVTWCQEQDTHPIPEALIPALQEKLREGAAQIESEHHACANTNIAHISKELSLPDVTPNAPTTTDVVTPAPARWGALTKATDMALTLRKQAVNATGEIGKQAGDLTDGLRKRGKGITLLAQTYGQDVLTTLQSPWTGWHATRTALNALWTQGVVGSTLRGLHFDSVLLCTLFPPAIPYVLGVALIEGGSDAWKEGHDIGTREAQEKETKHKAALEETRKRAKALLAGQQSLVSLSTPCLHVVIDVDTGRRTGVVLRGKHAGESLDRLSREDMDGLLKHAPDAETARILKAWAA